MLGHCVLYILTAASMLSLSSCNNHQNPLLTDNWLFPLSPSMYETRIGKQMPPHHEPDAVLINSGGDESSDNPGGGYPGIPGGPGVFGNPGGSGGPRYPRGPNFPDVLGFPGFDGGPDIRRGPGVFVIPGSVPQSPPYPGVFGMPRGVPQIPVDPTIFQMPGGPPHLPGSPPQLPRSPPQLPGGPPQLPGGPPQLPGSTPQLPRDPIIFGPNAFGNPQYPHVSNWPSIFNIPRDSSQVPGGQGVFGPNTFVFPPNLGKPNEPGVFTPEEETLVIPNNPGVFLRPEEQGGPVMPNIPGMFGVPSRPGPSEHDIPNMPPYHVRPDAFPISGSGDVPFSGIPGFFVPGRIPNAPRQPDQFPVTRGKERETFVPEREKEFSTRGIFPGIFVSEKPFFPDHQDSTTHQGRPEKFRNPVQDLTAQPSRIV